jgi:hypothetical protein
MARTAFDELVHRVNNLLGTIEIQAELARSEGTLPAHVSAVAHIVESAVRTREDLMRLRAAAEKSTDR